MAMCVVGCGPHDGCVNDPHCPGAHIVGFERLVSNNEVAGFKFAALGVGRAVLLGFAVVTVWEKSKATQEA
jgi:hypothetical protein